jgi:hypothetical protein
MSIVTMYVSDMLSIPDIHKKTGIPLSNIRYALKKEGVLRSRSDSIRLAAKNGKLGGGLRGKTRVFTESWKRAISKARIKYADENAIGFSRRPSGYLEHTRGVNKGRGVHVVIMESIIGRRLFAFEVVHHIDGNKENNSHENLQIMTRSDHTTHHNIENAHKRKRNKNGKFE